MASLNIKGFPEDLYKMLQDRARRECRSVAQEVIYILSQTVREPDRLSITDLRGVGKEAWQGVNTAEHGATERDAVPISAC